MDLLKKGLMIHGRNDKVVPLEGVMSTGEYFKNFMIWENNAHMIPIESIKEYA
jgi:pimeloyl-ACP methyl ester carboxylesterase